MHVFTYTVIVSVITANWLYYTHKNFGVLATQRAWAEVTYRQTDKQTDYCNPSHPHTLRLNDRESVRNQG